MDEDARHDSLDTALLRLAHDAARRRLRTEAADAARLADGANGAPSHRRGSAARVSRLLRQGRRDPRPDER
jgi:hypothetical protein